ncbi:uncharacterized protein Gasu_63650 [Galdieria sulphuraria]|uniref:Uncharacterized protein n=1 Tax=Galdieria sulphuraria TaxID=130081 RepID=M2XQS0_GALSU|nr:uncharacterized protein Gasu_63650 [Galdieria sulphuraria]EME25978.1 hypothetical protein Gasu_63650 [Galdieria sulphuraria]|eukprot:XP_005702498.1 hypothetical protein Gasu_63650 [Galdieria sulphuraria]
MSSMVDSTFELEIILNLSNELVLIPGKIICHIVLIVVLLLRIPKTRELKTWFEKNLVVFDCPIIPPRYLHFICDTGYVFLDRFILDSFANRLKPYDYVNLYLIQLITTCFEVLLVILFRSNQASLGELYSFPRQENVQT